MIKHFNTYFSIDFMYFSDPSSSLRKNSDAILKNKASLILFYLVFILYDIRYML